MTTTEQSTELSAEQPADAATERAATTYEVRLVSVYATHWRHDGTTGGTTGETAQGDIVLGERLKRFYDYFAEQLPRILAHTKPRPQEVSFGDDPGREHGCRVTQVEVFVFALPFPADQVVAALVVDFERPDVNVDRRTAQHLLRSCAGAEVSIGG